jgi:spermidine synthase
MLLMGAAFPLGLEIWIGGVPSIDRGRRVGAFYSANLAGSILGAVIAGFVLLPSAGSRGTLLAVALATGVSGVMLLWLASMRRWSAAIVAVAMAIVFVAAVRRAPNPIAELMTDATGARLFWYEEGIQTTASIVRTLGHLVLYLNGHHQADDTRSMVDVHRQIGHLPMAVHPAPRDALVIGLGGGATADAVSRHPGVNVDLVELAASVVHAADWFTHINSNVLRNPRVRLRVDDGRNHLMLSRRRYDVITADIIQPTHAGAGNLYSAEYFTLARDALNDDGMMLQWIGHRDRNQYELIMRTFLRVFPDATVWADGTLMLGTKRPFRLNADRIRRKLQDPETRAVYEALGTPTIESLLRLYTAGPEDARRFVGEGPVLTDDRPSLEYFLSLDPPRPLDITRLRGDVRAIFSGS